MSRSLALAAVIVVIGCSSKGSSPGAVDDAAVKVVPAPAVDPVLALVRVGVDKGWLKGAAIAVLTTGEGTRYWYAGDDGRGEEPGPDTIFEIGSITKVFTGLLLADAAERGEVALDQPASKYTKLPVPKFKGKAPTLRQLSNHTSGLPRLPDWKPLDIADPYAQFGRTELSEFLAAYKLPRAPGESYEYSNLAAGLLGTILADRAGTSYAALVTERIAKPLGLHDTVTTLSPDQRERFAEGHNGLLKPVPAWTFKTLGPAGSIRSTITDMAAFARIQLQPTGPLEKAIRTTQELQPAGDQKLGLGWHSDPKGNLWHNGGTGGFHSFLIIDKERRAAVVILSNTSTNIIDPLGAAILQLTLGQKPTFTWP